MSCGSLRLLVVCLSLAGCGALGPPPPDFDGATTDGGLDQQPVSVACLACLPTENCLADTCYPAPPDCAGIAAHLPKPPDGVYHLNLAGIVQAAYCDMRTERILCAATEGEHSGATRDQSQVPFLLRSVLEDGTGFCRIWAVRDEFGFPLSQLRGLEAAPEALVKSTCESLGFQGGDQEFKQYCRFGANPGWTDCGFPSQTTSAVKVKWGNTCDCNETIGKPFYGLEKGVFTSVLPWTFDGRVSARCQVRR